MALLKISCSLLILLIAADSCNAVDPKIVGGEDAAPAQFKYIASLRSSNSHFCCGSIISSKTVLTACHCLFKDIQKTTVVVGTNKLSTGGVSYTVQSFIRHSGYDSSTFRNDIGLIIVKNSITFNSLVASIGLPTNNIGVVDCRVAGWGLTSYPGNKLPDKLQFIDLKTLTTASCKSKVTNMVYTSQICTLTKEGEGICSGDSGGPLVVDDKVQGITSAGYLCAKGLPDFFTRVYYFRMWVITNMQ